MMNSLIKKREEKITGPRLIIGYLGLFMILAGVLACVPLVTLVYYYDCLYAWWYFFLPGSISIFFGSIQYSLIYRKNVGKLQGTEEMFLTIAVWIIAILVNSFPFYIWGHVGGYNTINPEVGDVNNFINYANKTLYYVKGGEGHTFFYFTQAVFESASCIATVGLTLFPTENISGKHTYNMNMFSYEVDNYTEFVPGTEIFLFHRAFLCLIAGVGLALVLASALSNRSFFQIYLLEGHSDKLMPNLSQSARRIFLYYLSFVAFGAVGYLCCGMTFFDSICYAMTAVSTSGFANHATSIMFFEVALGQSRAIAIEAITIVLMFLGATSFMVHHYFFKGQFKKAFLNQETITRFIFIAFFLPLVYAGFRMPYNDLMSLANTNQASIYVYFEDPGQAFRHALFEFTSISTTSGFASIPSYESGSLAPITYISFILLAFIGGMGGSTAGGIKFFRIGDIFLSFKEIIASKVRKQEVVHTCFTYKYGEKVPILDSQKKEALDFAVIYISSIFAFTLIPVFIGYSFQDSLFEVASAIANLGETSGLSLAASNAHQWGVLWSLIFVMILGRLEINIFFFLFAKFVNDIKSAKHRVKTNR